MYTRENEVQVVSLYLTRRNCLKIKNEIGSRLVELIIISDVYNQLIQQRLPSLLRSENSRPFHVFNAFEGRQFSYPIFQGTRINIKVEPQAAKRFKPKFSLYEKLDNFSEISFEFQHSCACPTHV